MASKTSFLSLLLSQLRDISYFTASSVYRTPFGQSDQLNPITHTLRSHLSAYFSLVVLHAHLLERALCLLLLFLELHGLLLKSDQRRVVRLCCFLKHDSAEGKTRPGTGSGRYNNERLCSPMMFKRSMEAFYPVC